MADRRWFLKVCAIASLARPSIWNLTDATHAVQPGRSSAAVQLCVRPSRIELAPEHAVSVAAYNGAFPAPLLRARQGAPLHIDLHNTTPYTESFRCTAGMFVLAGEDVSAADEPAVVSVPAGGAMQLGACATRRLLVLTDIPGAHLYQSDQLGPSLLQSGPYSAQAGVILVEPRADAGRYDREYVLVLKEFQPSLHRGPAGFETRYASCTVNGRMLGYGEPLRVKQGERMLLHVVNASASETRHLALPGHAFHVVSLDGHAVCEPRAVSSLRLGAGERLSALVSMQTAGVWLLGDLHNSERAGGLGIVVEYAARRGAPRWQPPRTTRWDYLQLSARPPGLPPTQQGGNAPTVRLPVVIARVGNTRGFSRFTVNGRSFSAESPAAFRLRAGHRYRLHFDNASDNACCLHLTGHPFELVSSAAEWHTGLSKDVLLLERGQRLVADIAARAPGTFLLQCRRQLQRDFGLAARVEVI